MKKIMFITLVVSMLILSGCSQAAKIEQTETPDSNEKPDMVPINKTAEFKITKQSATRYPPSVNGTIKNIGLGRGSLTVIARVYYAGSVSSEALQSFENIKPDEEVRFDMPIDEVALWTSYGVILEQN